MFQYNGGLADFIQVSEGVFYQCGRDFSAMDIVYIIPASQKIQEPVAVQVSYCLLYTSDAADEG